MAYGAQDWVARTDILLQTLQELIIRPKYGTRGLLEFQNYVTANAETSLGVISGKGVIYGGAIVIIGAATCKDDQVGCKFDTEATKLCPSFITCAAFNLVGPHGATYQLECYDDVNFYYSLGVQFGMTFESSAEFIYKEAMGRTPLVAVKIKYAVL